MIEKVILEKKGGFYLSIYKLEILILRKGLLISKVTLGQRSFTCFTEISSALSVPKLLHISGFFISHLSRNEFSVLLNAFKPQPNFCCFKLVLKVPKIMSKLSDMLQLSPMTVNVLVSLAAGTLMGWLLKGKFNRQQALQAATKAAETGVIIASCTFLKKKRGLHYNHYTKCTFNII